MRKIYLNDGVFAELRLIFDKRRLELVNIAVCGRLANFLKRVESSSELDEKPSWHQFPDPCI